jgi:predicted component of type VI protein secretion system
MDDSNALSPGCSSIADGGPSATASAPFFAMRLVLPGGRAVELNRPDMVIGRHSAADIRLHLPDVSRRHCRFLFSDGHWQVFDLHSLNGLFVNEEQVKQATLRDQDVIRIGSYTFSVDLHEGADLAAAPAPRKLPTALPEDSAGQRRQAS